MAKTLSNRIIGLYYLFFYLAWSVVEQILDPWLDTYLDGWILELLISGVMKSIIWILPSLWLANHYKQNLFVGMKEMFTNPVRWSVYLPVFGLFTVYHLIGGYLLHDRLAISSNFNLSYVIIVLFVGITEEMVFRGWLLNAMLIKQRQLLAITINAMLFLIIHIPRFIEEGLLVKSIFNGSYIGIILLSILFSVTFIKSKNLMVPLLLHMYWDLLIFLFII